MPSRGRVPSQECQPAHLPLWCVDAVRTLPHEVLQNMGFRRCPSSSQSLGYVEGICVYHEFRAGNESAGAGAVEFLEGCEAQLPAGQKIYLRSDSAFYQAAVMNQGWERQGTFTITADQDRAVKAVIGQIPESAWKAYRTREGMATDREIAETVHCLNQTRQAFRLIVVRWK